MASFKMTNVIDVQVTSRISVKVGLSSLYRTSTLEVSRITAFGTRKRLFLTPLQYHAIILNEMKVNAIVKSITSDAENGRPVDEETFYTIPIDPRKSITVEVFKGKVYVTIHTYKNEEMQKALAFGMTYENEFQEFMRAKDSVLAALDEVKQALSLKALRDEKKLRTYTWAIVSEGTGIKTSGKRLYYDEVGAFELARKWAEAMENSGEGNHTPCIIERRLEWPTCDTIFRCTLLALVTRCYDEAVKGSQKEGEDSAAHYEKARASVTVPMVEQLLKEVYNYMGDKKRFQGLDSVAPLTSEEERDLQRLVVERLHNSLTQMELSVFLACYDIAVAGVYPEYICGWYSEVEDMRTRV